MALHKLQMLANLSPKQQQGQLAETCALGFLQNKGLRLIERNAQYKFGELDIVMRDGEELVFVEVRQRKSNLFGGAAQSIDRRKMKKCALAAQCWLKQHAQFAKMPCRFDAVLLTGTENNWQIDWIQNAFVFQDVF
jgi:putative endonuclease